MPTTQETVPTGPYFGFTLAEMEIELERHKADRKRSGSNLISSSVNGQSFTFGNRADGSLEQRGQDIQAALYYLDPGRYPFQPPTNSAVISQG